MKRGPFYLITPDDFRIMAECLRDMHSIQGNSEDEITFEIYKWTWADKEHFDLRPYRVGTHEKNEYEILVGEYRVGYRIEDEAFFQYVIEEGWLE